MLNRDDSNECTETFTVPCVRDLMLAVDAITLDANPLEVLALLQTTDDIPALPIVDDHNNYIGLVAKHNYLSLMTDNRAHELFSHDALRPTPNSLANLFNSYPDVFTAPLVAYDDDPIDRVVRDFLSHDSDFSFAALPVIGKRGVLGVVKIADMISK